MTRMWWHLAGLLVAGVGIAQAQPYPSKPIRVVVGFVAGGPADALARVYAHHLGDALGQQIVVENRGGADGVIAAESVARAAPDGYTLFFATSGHAVNASLYKVPYRTLDDFEPVALIGESPNVLAVAPSLPVKDLDGFIALARTKPGALNYGATSSVTYLATELLTATAGIQVTRVPFKGAAPATAALMAGDVQLLLSGIGTMLPHVRAGRVKGLAVTSGARAAIAPDLPTVGESGVPGYVATTWYGVLAPAGTPRAVVRRLHGETETALAQPAAKAALELQGIIAAKLTAEEFRVFLRDEVGKWARVVHDSGARVE